MNNMSSPSYSIVTIARGRFQKPFIGILPVILYSGGEVKVVIQMEDGSRHQDMFTPDTTLFDILIATGLSL